jgi:hypothetical protein
MRWCTVKYTLNNQPIPWSRALEYLIATWLVILLLCLQEPGIGPYIQLDESNLVTSLHCFLKLHFNITLPSIFQSPKLSLPFKFLD